MRSVEVVDVIQENTEASDVYHDITVLFSGPVDFSILYICQIWLSKTVQAVREYFEAALVLVVDRQAATQTADGLR